MTNTTPTLASVKIGIRTVRTMLSTSLLAGTAEWVVARRLGHAHVQTTLDLYGWVREDEALRAAANWASYASSWRVPDGR
jgi:integrase